jgi:hypothetical protein
MPNNGKSSRLRPYGAARVRRGWVPTALRCSGLSMLMISFRNAARDLDASPLLGVPFLGSTTHKWPKEERK